MTPPNPRTDPEHEQRIERLLRALPDQTICGFFIRWAKGIPPKPVPLSLLGRKPEKPL